MNECGTTSVPPSPDPTGTPALLPAGGASLAPVLCGSGMGVCLGKKRENFVDGGDRVDFCGVNFFACRGITGGGK